MFLAFAGTRVFNFTLILVSYVLPIVLAPLSPFSPPSLYHILTRKSNISLFSFLFLSFLFLLLLLLFFFLGFDLPLMKMWKWVVAD